VHSGPWFDASVRHALNTCRGGLHLLRRVPLQGAWWPVRSAEIGSHWPISEGRRKAVPSNAFEARRFQKRELEPGRALTQ
jgi:hypothetical protein